MAGEGNLFAFDLQGDVRTLYMYLELSWDITHYPHKMNWSRSEL